MNVVRVVPVRDPSSDCKLMDMYSSILLVFLVSLAELAEASTCNFQAISLPLKDVQVLPNIANSFMRGIPVTLGSPSQDIVVLPWAELNNTWLYDYDSLCDNSIIFSDTICRVRRGNFYFENASTTYEKNIDVLAAGGASVESSGVGAENGIANLLSTSIGGTDSFSPGSTNLSGFPIGIPRQAWDHGYTIMHAMGMGSNSTYLNSLVDAGKIASRVWSIFWGRMWIDNPLDGSVVVGGYDQQKVIGKNYTQRLDYSDATGCWTGMKVTISDIRLITRTGDTSSIFPANFALPVCIVPQRQNLIEAPGVILTNFENVTNTQNTGLSFGLHWGARLYNATNFFDGDMSLHFSSGLQITIPNSQYMVPYVTIERNGSRIFDDNTREFLYDTVADQPATLGRYFLTAAYLMVNHDSGTFTLWQANPSTASQTVAVVSESTAAECAGVSNATGVVQPSAVANSNPDRSGQGQTDRSGQEQTGLSGGVIAGVVVGAVVGVACVSLAVLFIIRKKKGASGSVDGAAFINGGDHSMTSKDDSSWQGPYEAQGSQTAHELVGTNYRPGDGPMYQHIHEMDGGH